MILRQQSFSFEKYRISLKHTAFLKNKDFLEKMSFFWKKILIFQENVHFISKNCFFKKICITIIQFDFHLRLRPGSRRRTRSSRCAPGGLRRLLRHRSWPAVGPSQRPGGPPAHLGLPCRALLGQDIPPFLIWGENLKR